MKDKKHQLGYTIIEVMIVLAVSGMMFVVAVNFINGKQAKTAFSQGSNELGSRIQKVADDVANGHYSDVPLDCNATGGQAEAVYANGSQQGTNSNCVFLGKLLHFYIKDGTTLPENYEVISLADLRLANDDDPLPRASVAQIGDLTVQQKVPQALGVKSMVVKDTLGGTHNGVYSIGFVQGAGSIANAATGEYKSGAQTVGTVYSGATNASSTVQGTNNASGNNIMKATSAEICVTDGKRYAKILIGGIGQGSQLSIRVKQLGQEASLC